MKKHHVFDPNQKMRVPEKHHALDSNQCVGAARALSIGGSRGLLTAVAAR